MGCADPLFLVGPQPRKVLQWRSSYRSTADPRCPTPTGSAASPSASSRPRSRATTSSSWSRRWATPPTTCSTWPSRCVRRRRPREMDMLLTAGERISNALVAMAIASLGAQARSFTGSQAGVITTGTPRQREDHRRHAGPAAVGARRGPDRAGRRLPGRQPGQQGRHHARPRRVGHHGRRAGRGAGRRRVRDLHRRRRRSSPPTRASCPTRGEWTPCRSRKCSRWRRAAPRC